MLVFVVLIAIILIAAFSITRDFNYEKSITVNAPIEKILIAWKIWANGIPGATLIPI